MTDRFKFKRVNEITGTFLLLVIVALVVTVVWTGRSQRWFKSNVTLRIVLPEAGAAGIRHGSEVYFLGTLVGSVSDVIVDTNGRMAAEANIRYDFFRFVREDSSAVVKRKFGVAGDSFFEITRGAGAPLPEKNAGILCKEQFQSALEAAVEEVRREALLALKKVNGGLDTWTKLGVDIGETRQRVDQIAAHLETLTAGLESGTGILGKLMTDRAMAEEAQKLLGRANDTMIELQDVVTNLGVAVNNVRQGTTRLPEITGAMANETKDLPGLVQQTQTSMREMERLVEAMQRHWFLRKYVNKTNPAPVRPLPGMPEREKTTTETFSSPKGSRK